MSVIVKNMEMPENCDVCRMRTDACFCSAMPKEFCGYADEQKRPDWCPLVELPEKHGDLIDRDVLLKQLNTAIAIMSGMMKALDANADEGMQMELKAYKDIRDGIKEYDVVIEAEGE